MDIETKKVEKRGSKFCVVHCSPGKEGKIIKCFSTKEKADAMHRAIQANKDSGLEGAETIGGMPLGNDLEGLEVKSLQMSTSMFSYEVVETKAGKEYYVSGYVSTYERDLVDDIVTKDCMKDMFGQVHNRNMKLDLEHEAFRGKTPAEREMNKSLIPFARIVEERLDDVGIWVKAKLNTAYSRFGEAWQSIKDKFIDAFSIAYKAVKWQYEATSTGRVRLLEKVNLFNIGVTGNAVNIGSRMTGYSTKSLPIMREVSEDLETEDKAKDKRPPKSWWDKCISGVSKVSGVKDPAALCGWLYKQPGHHGIKSRDFDDEIDTLNHTILEVKSMVEKEAEASEETKPEAETTEPAKEEETKEETTDEKKPEETTEKPDEKKPEEEAKKEGGEEKPLEEIKNLILEKSKLEERLKSLEKTRDNPQIKALLEKKPEVVEEKAKTPLDTIGGTV